MKTLASLIILGFFSLGIESQVNASEVTCTVSNGTHWETATVGILANGAQAIYHVRARGIYLTADLICTIDGRCVGITAGQLEIKGQLHFAKSGPQRVAAVTFATKTKYIPDGQFSCP